MLVMLFASMIARADELATDTAPLFAAKLADLDDRPATLAAYAGRPLVVNFWARWCEPCRREIPDLIGQRARFRERGLEVVGIAIDDNPGAVRDFAKAYGIDYPSLLAKDGAIDLLKALGNRRAVLPFTLVLDRKGEAVSSKLGPMSESQMEQAFRQALE